MFNSQWRKPHLVTLRSTVVCGFGLYDCFAVVLSPCCSYLEYLTGLDRILCRDPDTPGGSTVVNTRTTTALILIKLKNVVSSVTSDSPRKTRRRRRKGELFWKNVPLFIAPTRKLLVVTQWSDKAENIWAKMKLVQYNIPVYLERSRLTKTCSLV